MTNIQQKLKENEALRNAFGFLYSVKLSDEAQGKIKGGLLFPMIGHVELEDVFAERKYSEELFGQMEDFLFESAAKDFFIEMINDGYILPACVKGVNLNLPVEYQVQEALIKA
ncbi:hypothetical protein EVU96_24785 [Bacillus infantis]|uniref:hypothetical protein n=1 Tax=Bacillus infantis TaxID=324767 RepID=UPI00101C4D28|nr:hypothetical protein [Bacillus infantis]RYI25185.1 hypothetical protein EVU96_24785 [Bacillus infantis]